MPKCIFCPKPEYSQDARDAKVEGTVYVTVIVLATGVAGEIKVVKGIQESLDKQAIKTIREEWKFTPGTDQNGDSVDVIVPVEIRFQLFGPPQPTPPPADSPSLSGNSASRIKMKVCKRKSSPARLPKRRSLTLLHGTREYPNTLCAESGIAERRPSSAH